MHEKIYFNLITIGADNGTWRADRVSSRKIDEPLTIGVVNGEAEERQQKLDDCVIDVHIDYNVHQCW